MAHQLARAGYKVCIEDRPIVLAEVKKKYGEWFKYKEKS